MEPVDHVTMERRALERLVSALTGDDTPPESRIERIENAIAFAMVALEGDEKYLESESSDLQSNLFSLSLQFIDSRLQENGAVVVSATYQDKENDPDVMYFWATKDEILAAMIELSVNQYTKPKDENDIN